MKNGFLCQRDNRHDVLHMPGHAVEMFGITLVLCENNCSYTNLVAIYIK
jgi:hypothetical protein